MDLYEERTSYIQQIKECKHIRQTKCTSVYIIIALLHSSLFVSLWLAEAGRWFTG